MRPLIVRLRNWVGEVMLALPTLQRLEAEGYAVHLIGRPWARSLLAATGWSFDARPKARLEAIRQLRQLRRRYRDVDPDFDDRPNLLLMPNSFSAALEGRMAGLNAVGRAADARSLLLHRVLPRQPNTHVAEEYWQLTQPILGSAYAAEVPPYRDLPVTESARQGARQALSAAGIEGPFVVCCPLSSGSGDLAGMRRWPHFGALTAALKSPDLPVVTLPGPGEEGLMAAACPEAIALPRLDLGVYAAVLQEAAAVVANDTGPGHMAAMTGSRLISVLGPYSETRWYPLARRGRRLHPVGRWPTVEEVLEAVHAERSAPHAGHPA